MKRVEGCRAVEMLREGSVKAVQDKVEEIVMQIHIFGKRVPLCRRIVVGIDVVPRKLEVVYVHSVAPCDFRESEDDT